MSLQDSEEDVSKESEIRVAEAKPIKNCGEYMAVDAHLPETVDLDTSVCAEKIARITNDAELQEMLDYLSCSTTAHFKSQQFNDPEFDGDQKRQIAAIILAQNPAKFLSQFGRHLEEKHLSSFANKFNTEDYELAFHLKELKRFHSKEKKQVDVKNRRFQALKRLQDEGTYFSESVMKERNPLLYEQLIGQYLTQREIEERTQEAMRANSTLVGVLLAQIERDQMGKLLQLQKDTEDGAREEVDTSEEDSEPEMVTDDDVSSEDDAISRGKKLKKKPLSYSEKELLKTEFYSYMFNSFLDGKDDDFDYSQVDFNPDCDCLAVRAQDEEEKYFDSETPEEENACAKTTNEDDMEDDELDVFMNNLRPETTPSDLCEKIEDQAVL